jgi:ribonuclease HI
MMFSETHLSRPKMKALQKRLLANGFTAFGEAAVHKSDKGTSAGILVLAPTRWSPQPLPAATKAAICQGSKLGTRWMAVTLRFKRVTVMFVEVYLVSGEGLRGANLEILRQLQVLIRMVKMPTLIAGDWQCEPYQLQALQWLAINDLEVWSAGALATCSSGPGRELDFFVANRSMAAIILPELASAGSRRGIAELIDNVPWSPHSGIKLNLQSRPRTVMQRTLHVPRPLPVEQSAYNAATWAKAEQYVQTHGPWPAGKQPRVQQSDPMYEVLSEQQCELAKDLAEASATVEVYYLLQAGTPVEDYPKYMGRGQWPIFRSMPVVAPHTVDNHRYTSIEANWWAALAAGLQLHGKLAAKFRGHGQTEQLRSRIIKAVTEHQQVQRMWHAKATDPQAVEQAVQHFELDVVSYCSLAAASSTDVQSSQLEAELLGCIKQIANQQKDLWIRKKAKELQAGFRTWLVGALAGPASMAFQFIKDKEPVLEQAVAKPGGTWSLEPNDVMEVRQQHWAALWHQPEHRHRLATLVGELKAKHPVQHRSVEEEFSGDKLLHSLKGYSTKKARGVDHWSVGELKGLHPRAAQALAAPIAKAHRLLAWPPQLALNIMPVLPKPQGGERCIAKTSLLYRCWSRWRRPQVRAWESAKAESFDFAREACSALSAALLRGLEAETARLLGRKVAAILWDAHKFFDTVDHGVLASQAQDEEYPMEEFIMAIQMHGAPRVIQCNGTCSTGTLVTTSILAGCAQAVPLTKVHMQPQLREVSREHPQARFSLYVDDVGMQAVGTFKAVLRAITGAGLRFIEGMNVLKLQISGKTTVIATSKQLAAAVQKHLRRHGVQTKTAEHGRDLGISLQLRGRRSVALTASRQAAGIARLKKIQHLATITKQARRLAVPSGMSVACWGQAAAGRTPTQVANLRAALAAATGLRQARRCPITAIWLGFGLRQDPQARLIRDTVTTWYGLWRSLGDNRSDVRKAWRIAHSQVVTGEFGNQVNWAQVKGPITATIATLTSQGWNAAFPDVLKDPQGQDWCLSHEEGGPGKEMQEQLQRIVDKQLWAKAANSWHGRGLQDGPDETATLRWHSQLKRRGRYKELAALETIMVGGCWSEERVQLFIRPADTPLCSRCGSAATDDLHAFWTCPGLRMLQQAEVVSTQRLIPQAILESEQSPCLWFRGLAPSIEADSRYQPSDQLDMISYGSTPQSPWPGGRFWTDGSGGLHSSIPVLRRCGCGIATLKRAAADPQDFERDWGYSFSLPGQKQTVPRAELMAILVILQNVEPLQPVDIASDSMLSVALFLKGPRHTMGIINEDLWCQIWAAVRRRKANTTVRWIKSHSGRKEIDKGLISVEDSKGNEWADKLADRAAELACVPALYAAPILAQQAQVIEIQMRLVAVLMTMEKRPRVKAKKEVQPPVQVSTSTEHQLIAVNDERQWCALCLSYSPKGNAARVKWLPRCPGRLGTPGRPAALPAEHAAAAGKVFHGSHSLSSYRGLCYCSVCGAYGNHKARKLLQACRPPEDANVGSAQKQHWLYGIRKIQKGQLPSGLSCWPDEADPRAQQQVKAFPEWLEWHRSRNSAGPSAGSFEAPTACEKKARRVYLREAMAPAPWRAAAASPVAAGHVAAGAGESAVPQPPVCGGVRPVRPPRAQKQAKARGTSAGTASSSSRPAEPLKHAPAAAVHAWRVAPAIVPAHAGGAAAASAACPREASGKTTPTAALGGISRRSRPFSFERVQRGQAEQASGGGPTEAELCMPAAGTSPAEQPGQVARLGQAALTLEAEDFSGVQLPLAKKKRQPRRRVAGGTGSDAAAVPEQASSSAAACTQSQPDEVGSPWQDFQRLFEPAEEPAAQLEQSCAVPSEPLRAPSSPEQVLSSQELEAELEFQLALEGFD